MRCYRVSFFYLWHFSIRCLPLSLSQYLSALLSLTSRRLLFCHWIFLSATGLTSRCLLSCHRIFLSATKLTSRRFSFPTFDICRCHWIGAYTSICASENPGIRLFANSHFFRASAHQGPYRIFCQGLCFASGISWEKISTCLIGLTGLQTVPGYLLILADEDQAVPNQLK